MTRSQRMPNPVLLVCDVQEKFRPAIYEYPKVITTAQKTVRACKSLQIPIFATTQNAARLGSICAELASELPNAAIDKTAFSMMVPELRTHLQGFKGAGPCQVAIVGIESHICVTQSALDLMADGHRVYILADGVSSCNEGERGIALSRLRAAGAVITSSESWIYECMGDAAISEFKSVASLVKETKESTRDAVQTLCKM